MMTSDPAETFRQEARELLEQLELALLDLDRKPGDQDLIDSAFRALHTIKGSGAMFGFDRVAAFAHEFETAFDRVRKGLAPPSHELIVLALKAKDHVHALIEQPETSETGEEILVALHQVVAVDPSELGPSVLEGAAHGGDIRAVTWRVRFHLPPDALVAGANPMLLLDELRTLGPCEVLALSGRIPPLAEMEPEHLYLGWEVVVTTSSPREAIEDVFLFLRDDMELAIEPIESAAGPAAETPPPGPVHSAPSALTERKVARDKAEGGAAAPDKISASLRVPAERLDELMDRVGELVIAQARLTQIAAQSNDANLKTIAEELDRLSSGLRDTTMGIRMIPIGTLFGRFRRLVHDLSHDLGKEITFVTSGEETELDKTMIERLADPLVHLIRNAVDHGLEAPMGREGAGKPRKGTVRLSAVHAGAEVAISVADDGAGLDAARIRAKAEEAGLLAADAKLTDSELFQFLFHPGFSTAREITSVSGRGVGMDVVKRTIEGLRGSIDIATVPGMGTTVTLRLPLTLAIIDGMLVRVGNGRYAIPLSAVEECVEIPAEVDQRSSGRSFLNIRGSLVPFLRLRELFKAKTPPDPYQKVVIVSSGEFRVGLVVDQIIGNNQTVIKSLSKLHAGIQNFSGATILGDGTVALILDVSQLVSYGQAFEDRLKARTLERAA